PLYGINVYVPNGDPGALVDGATCSRCNDQLPGNPLVRTVTDESGNFSLENMPAGANIPLIITSGTWRRQLTSPTVTACQPGPQPIPPDQTRLPATSAEGDIPRIALSTGGADALECLLRKIGISDSEFTSDAGNGRVHLYSDTMLTNGEGAD